MKSAPAAVASAPSAEQCEAWVRRVHEVQTQRMSPEKRQQLQARVELSRQSEISSRKCKALKGSASRSNALAKESLRQMASASASSPQAFLEVTARWDSAQKASEKRQTKVWNRLSSAPAAAVKAAAEESDEDEEEAVAEVSGLMAADANQLAADSAAAVGPVGVAGGAAKGDSFDKLLEQLRLEPAEGEECAAKFQLYEGYGQQVEKIRKLLFDFYQESEAAVPPAVAADMQRQLGKVDSHEAMGIPDDERVWFVYHMMRVAEKNNRAMAGVLDGFEKKLDFLAKNDQTECPVCLEEFTAEGPRAVETLSCCHKICQECWDNWKQVTHGHPFCPLCKYDQFLGFVASRATA